MDVDERETHREHEVWCREQKYAETPHKHTIEIRALDRHVLKQGITSGENYESSDDDTCCGAQSC
jgi:hypothetical protein